MIWSELDFMWNTAWHQEGFLGGSSSKEWAWGTGNPCYLSLAALYSSRWDKLFLCCAVKSPEAACLSTMILIHIKVLFCLFCSVQSLSSVQFFVTPWTAARQAALSITISQSSLKLTSIQSVMQSNHLVLCCPRLLLPVIFSNIRVFSNVSVPLNRRPKYWSFSFSMSPSNEYSVLISFRMDWLDLLAVQGTLKSLLQHHSSKASVQRSWVLC